MTDLSMIRGDSMTWDFTLLDAAGDPYDLTNAVVVFSAGSLIRTTPTVVDADAGEITVALEPGDTSGAPCYRARYDYDVQVTFDDGMVKTPARGKLIIIQDVTVD